MKRDKRVPDSDEGESKEKTEGSSKFSQKGLPEVDQLFSLHLDYSYFSLHFIVVGCQRNQCVIGNRLKNKLCGRLHSIRHLLGEMGIEHGTLNLKPVDPRSADTFCTCKASGIQFALSVTSRHRIQTVGRTTPYS